MASSEMRSAAADRLTSQLNPEERRMAEQMGVTPAEFYGIFQILNDAMVRPELAIRGRNELLALLSPMKRDVLAC